MVESKDIRFEFVKRTREILDSCPSDDQDIVTKLLNFSFGLIVFPREQIHYMKWPKYTFDSEDRKYGFTKSTIQYLNAEKPNYNLSSVVKNIRDGLFHGYIDYEYRNGEIVNLIIENRNSKNKPIKFRLVCSIDEFRLFVMQVSEDYLSIYKKLKKILIIKNKSL